MKLDISEITFYIIISFWHIFVKANNTNSIIKDANYAKAKLMRISYD